MIDLVSKRFLFLAISLLVIIPGTIAVLAGGLRPGIDFKGGTQWVVRPTKGATTEQFRQLVEKNGYAGSQVKAGSIVSGTTGGVDTVIMDLPGQVRSDVEKPVLEDLLVTNKLVAGTRITETIAAATPTVAAGSPTVASASGTVTGTIKGTGTITSTGVTSGTTASTTGTPGTGTVSAPAGKLVSRNRIDPSSEIDFRSVGPTVGSELLGRAFLAILAASAAILVYLTLVFRKIPNAFRYGVCAIIALLHDVLVVLGVFAILGFLFGLEIDALFVTAMLTVIGFSVHDTIVVFDRVRENIMRRRFERFSEVVNYSLVQTLARSINTSITVILTLFALYLFGGTSIRNFVLALLIGIISGTYSSIFNASMLLVIWENREWSRANRGGPPAASARASAR
ncbi:MAG: protein translocase subunit SecF [Chloroflexota bacterium]|nr:protein translocase subunit SecF [Chloroflexota bacterium]